MEGRGAYLVYASLEESALARLPGERFSVAEFTLAIAPAGSGPPGKRAVTIKTDTDSSDWFTFQASEEEYEERDQAALEEVWRRLHEALPQLGGDIEIIETANPRTFYDVTRRKLGMVLGAERIGSSGPVGAIGHHTSLSNVFLVGDTITAEPRMDAVVESAFLLANDLTTG
jgi:hypothetical protein